MGLPYSTDRGKTIIFVLTEDNAEVVFNKQMEIIELTMSPDNLELVLISVCGETADGITWTPDVTHTIYTKDGMLWFKDNPIE